MRKTIIYILSFILLMCTGCQESGNTDLSRDNTETGKSKADETVVIRVYDELASEIGITKGWMGKIFQDELGIQVEEVNLSETENADITIYCNEASLKYHIEEEQILEKGKLLEWNDKLLEEHGSNISKYLQDSLDQVADICGGKVYGVKRNNGVDGLSVGMIFTINSTSKHQEEAMELINWMAEPDNMITMTYGPKELCWNIDEDGYYYLTEFGLNRYTYYDEEMPEEYGGGTFLGGDVQFIGRVWNLDAVNPNSKHGESFNYETWKLMQ